MNFVKAPNRKGDKTYYYYDLGRGKGQRPTTGIFTYTKPRNQIEKNHNKEAIKLLDIKKSQTIIEQQAIGTPFIPRHRFKENFLDFYKEYVKGHQKENNRHLTNSLTQFKRFIAKNFIAPIEITEDLCKNFRTYLLERFTGETPLDYFSRYKEVVYAATKAKYFHECPVENVNAIVNPSVRLKEIIEAHEYIHLINTPCSNQEVGFAFIFCLYTGLRRVDVKLLKWKHLNGHQLVTQIIQKKTGKPVVITLHPTAQKILELQREKAELSGDLDGLIFDLPTADGANKVLGIWVKNAGIDKHITWSCARLSFSILLQDERVDNATVALLLGHTTTKQVDKTYKRHRPKDAMATISLLPTNNFLSIN